jgi:hypothetical protein
LDCIDIKSVLGNISLKLLSVVTTPSTNPFAWDVAMLAMESMEHGNPYKFDQQQLLAAQQQSGRWSVSSYFQLPDCWPQAPGLWLERAESCFEMMHVHDLCQMFCFMTDALPMRLVADLVAVPPVEEPYRVLKEHLMIAHALTPVQKAEKLFAIPQLGGRRRGEQCPLQGSVSH